MVSVLGCGGNRFGEIAILVSHTTVLWYTVGTLSGREKGTEMGYYVRIEEAASNFKIKKENFERGYEIMCDLNKLFNSSCGSLVEVLELLDFGVEYDDAGNISGLSYDDKSGCEETFLNALKPVIEEGSYLVWVGEEGEVWEMVF